MNKLNPAWLQKVDVQLCMTRTIVRKSLFITKQSEYIPSIYWLVLAYTQYVLIHTCITWNITVARHSMDRA